MKAYKGFNKDMTCRGFQFKEGETYETEEAKLCECGFHACEAPLEVFRYYAPSNSEYHEVELDGVSDEREYGTKVCAKKIQVGAKLSVEKLIELQIEYTKAHCTNEHNDAREPTVHGYPSYRGTATTGAYGVAVTGDRGASATCEYGVATAGYRGAATAGDRGVAMAYAHGAAAAGNYGVAMTTGVCGAATAGECGAATAGDCGVAAVGYRGAARAGECGVAMAGSFGAAAAGDRGVATSRGSASVGENGVAHVRGNNVRAKGDLGSIIIIVKEMDDTFEIYEWKAGVIDGETLKPNTWYKLEDGEFVECDED